MKFRNDEIMELRIDEKTNRFKLFEDPEKLSIRRPTTYTEQILSCFERYVYCTSCRGCRSAAKWPGQIAISVDTVAVEAETAAVLL